MTIERTSTSAFCHSSFASLNRADQIEGIGLESKNKTYEIIAPKFGKQYGIWYPLIWRLLSLHRFVSVSSRLPQGVGLAVDLYIACWWIIELLVMWVMISEAAFSTVQDLLICALLVYRLLDLIIIHSSILLRGFYRRPTKWLTGNRIVLLTILSGLEIMFIFGLIYRTLELVAPNAGAFEPPLGGVFTAVYVSVVTATTLGYGSPHPIGWAARSLAMLESCFVLLIVVVLISAIRGGFKPKLEDK